MKKEKVYPNRIREIRKSRKLSLDKLAEALNTSKSQIYDLEIGRNRLSVDWMNRLAKALDCSPADFLLTGSGAPTSEEMEILKIYRAMDEAGRAQALQVLKVLKSPTPETKADKVG